MPRAKDEPVRLTKIYTRGGDAGETSLGDGSRVSKRDPRITAYGAVDELNAAVGVVLAGDVPEEIRAVLERVQNELFDLGADLSVPAHVEGRLRVEQPLVDRLEADCDRSQRRPSRAPELRAARRHPDCRRAPRRADDLPPRRARGDRGGGGGGDPAVRGAVPEPALGPPLHPVARGKRDRGARRAALEARRDTLTVFAAALRLGATSFGGPIAHVGYFRDEYVARRRWIADEEFSELVAVTNLLPGPMSSQLGMAIGAHRAGIPGAIAAWLGFTLPSAVLMTAFALVIGSTDVAGAGWVHGLELVAVPVVLLAVLAMRRTLAPDRARLAVAVAGLALALGVGGFAGQLAALAVGAAVGLVAFGALARAPELNVRVGRRGLACDRLPRDARRAAARAPGDP